MSQPSSRSHAVALESPPEHILPNRQDLVQPYLSSVSVGWEGLSAEAFVEPRTFEGWLRPMQPDFSLTLVTGGSMYLEWRPVRAQRSWTGVTLRHGDLVLRPTLAMPYEMRWWCRSPTHTFNLLLPQEVLIRTAEQMEVGGSDPSRLSLVERAGFQDPLLLQLVLAVRRELEEGAPGGQLFADCTAQLITLHLLRHYTTLGDRTAGLSCIPSAHRLTACQLQRVIACIEDQLDQTLTLDVLAAQTGYSPSHFARLFRQTTGESPHQYVLRWRLEHAQQLLAASGLPLAQVAAACGFADQSTFTRAFTRAHGVTPSAYRRECIGRMSS